MDMMKVTTLRSQGPDVSFSLSGTCPHCSNMAVLTMVTQPPYIEPIPSPERPAGYRSERERICAAMQCPGCKKFVLAVVTRNENPSPGQPSDDQFIYEAHYPPGEPRLDLSEDIPAEIRSDLEEAIKCRWVKANKAAIVMCRRAIEAACNHLLGDTSKDSIRSKVEKLAKKGLITEPLEQWARRVQLEARAAAHPQEDGLDKITGEDAEAMIEFTQQFFTNVFVMPANLKRAVERAEQRESPLPASNP